MSAIDNQVGGDHYRKLKIQPAQYNHANSIPWFEGEVIKYVTRWRDKGGIKDLEKAKHVLDLLIEMEQKAFPSETAAADHGWTADQIRATLKEQGYEYSAPEIHTFGTGFPVGVVWFDIRFDEWWFELTWPGYGTPRAGRTDSKDGAIKSMREIAATWMGTNPQAADLQKGSKC